MVLSQRNAVDIGRVQFGRSLKIAESCLVVADKKRLSTCFHMAAGLKAGTTGKENNYGKENHRIERLHSYLLVLAIKIVRRERKRNRLKLVSDCYYEPIACHRPVPIPELRTR